MAPGKILLVTLGLALCWALAAFAYYPLPPHPPADKYGDVVMDRVATAGGARAVVFSHWSHRTRYSCRVCHFELNFAFQAGQTEITEADNRAGDFCGACHDGTQAFGHNNEEHCARCHTGPRVDRRGLFKALREKKPLPAAEFGNKINWSKALADGLIEPRYSIFRPDEKPMGFDKRLELYAEWNWVPPAIFDHAAHTPWLDCADCHPSIFNIQKKTTKHFLMEYILEKKFCGVCHYSVALPLDDCHACHPGMNRRK